MFRKMLLDCLLIFVLLTICCAADWPQWLGPDRNGIIEGTRLASSWPKEGPKQVWKIKCDFGGSTPVISDGIIVLYDRAKGKGSEETIHGIDAATGNELWKVSNSCNWSDKRTYSPGPCASPVISKEKVVCIGVEGVITCLELRTGKIFWTKDLKEQFTKLGQYGFVRSPLISGEKVIIQICSNDAGLIALDLKDGKEIWRSPYFPDYGAESPGYMEQNGVPLVVVTGNGPCKGFGDVMGVRISDGKIMWYITIGINYYNDPTPIYMDGRLIVEKDQDGPTVSLKLPVSGEGKAEIEWKGLSHMVRFGNYLYYKGLLFGYCAYAHGKPSGAFYWCADPKDGKLLWEEKTKKFTYNWLIGSDGKVLQLLDDGTLVMSEASAREGYKELARAKVTDANWDPPALSDGKMYIRSNTKLICLDLSAQ